MPSFYSFFECLAGLVLLDFFFLQAPDVVVPVQLTQLTVSCSQGYKTESCPFLSAVAQNREPVLSEV